MAKNFGTLVSRVLDNSNRNFNNIIFQKQKPPLDSEWNLLQDIFSDKLSNIVKETVPSGFLELSDIQTAPSLRSSLNSNWTNTIIFKNPIAIVNGWIIHLGGGTNQFQEGSQTNIWKSLSSNEDELVVIGDEAPSLGYSQDLVFLEVWQKLITTSDSIYMFGNVQSALDSNENDLIDTDIELETTKRIQIQYRVRWVQGVDFTSYREGITFPGCYAQGAATSPNSNYTFRKHDTDVGLYISGDGSTSAQTNLNTVDGYVYAIPLARIHRRNKQAYSLTNQNGSSISLLSGDTSDRPDGLYYDEISSRDVEDLRHQVSFTGFNYSKLLEENLHLLWSKNLPRELKYNDLDDNTSGNILVQTDGISTSTYSGINEDDRDPDGVKRVFCAARESQKVTVFLEDPTLLNGKLTFIPSSIDESGAYTLFDEDVYYISSKVPTVRIYDDTSAVTITSINGTWTGLGEERTYATTSGTHNKVIFQPTVSTALDNQKVVIEFEFIVREGGGLSQTTGGFTYQIKNMLNGYNTKDGKPVDFNLYTDSDHVVSLSNARTVGNYTDSAIARSISHFESAASSSSTSTSKYKGGVVELTYYVLSDGSSTTTIPSTLYNRSVVGILSIQNLTLSTYLTPTIKKTASNSFELTGLIADENDILKYTLLLGNYSIDYVPHTKGIRNIVKTHSFTNTITIGTTSGLINIKEKFNQSDAALATLGFYDGYEYKHICFINGTMYYLEDISGLGSPLITYTLEDASTLSGQIEIPMLVYYSPNSSDNLYFQYEYIPYAGIINTRLLNSTDTQKVKVLKVDENITITTAGTGSENQYLPNYYAGLTETLPINKKVYDYSLFGESLPTPITGGSSSIRRIPGHGITSQTSTHYALKEGQEIEIILGSGNKEMLRGAIINTPKIYERGIDFSSDTLINHLTQWSALVVGEGIYEGELLLLVITTISTKYNSTEGSEYEYLTAKGLYKASALGKASETILNNDVTTSDLSQNLATKIIGAVDIFPIKYRPLIK